MAPGGKKKNINRKAGDIPQENKKNLKIINKDIDNSSQISSKDLYVEDNSQDKKYHKRSIIKNWEKYDEVPVDPLADTLRGEDFEVLLSYSGGSGSQLQLQDEKDWEDVSIDEKAISLDIKDLIHVVKSISFPKQINLPLDIFSKEQLAKFENSAKHWRISCISNLNLDIDKKEKQDEVKDTLGPDLNIINICDEEDTEKAVLSKSVLLEKKTETIIESLTSCLSLKNSAISETNTSTVTEIKKESEPDELDFLLSLNVSLKNPLQDQKQSESKTNVDDWLNSILDE